jgi:hypothetical protein
MSEEIVMFNNDHFWTGRLVEDSFTVINAYNYIPKNEISRFFLA